MILALFDDIYLINSALNQKQDQMQTFEPPPPSWSEKDPMEIMMIQKYTLADRVNGDHIKISDPLNFDKVITLNQLYKRLSN